MTGHKAVPRHGYPRIPKTTGIPNWHLQAACIGRNSLFFSQDPEDHEAAKTICRACPVIAECAAWAKENRPAHGIWAGKARRSR